MVRKILIVAPAPRRPLAAVACAAASSLLQQQRFMNVNRSVQTRWELDNQQASQGRTDYDFDKDQWMKQMKFASMDCIMDPDVSAIRYTSIAGCKKAFRRFITMKKLTERRPDFNAKELQELFIDIKRTGNEKNQDIIRKLQRLTTHGEAARIINDIKAKMNEDFAKKSWKALKSQEAASAYEMEVNSFTLVNCYMGQMSKDDWLQITYRCEYRERDSKEFDWTKMTEYPVFEVRLGDGVSSPNNYPFIVVGLMRKDGTRYGKDTQDAATLRKQFDRSNRWF